MTPTELKLPIVAAVYALLKPLGYRKSSALFRREIGDVVHLIEVQASVSNKVGDASFTVNIGVFAPELVYADVRDVTSPSIPLAQWRTRLGQLAPESQDLWWCATTRVDAEAAAKDIVERIEKHALPALAALPDLASLGSVWKSGRSPGLTERQRVEFLNRLPASP
ncbi:DUF4304 domain-containing protein [Roseateles sp. P5_D6]